MRICGLVQDSIVDGPGFRFVCFVQGCPHRCPGCHNPESHDPGGGREMAVEEAAAEMLRNPLTDGLTLSGGEPMAQAAECRRLAEIARERRLNVWCYTGYTFEDLLTVGTAEQRSLLDKVDVLVDGPFLLAQRSLELKYCGSRNQRLIDVKKTLSSGVPTLWEPPVW